MIPVVDIRDLRVRFHGEREVYAVNGVDLALRPGEVLGLLGELGQERDAARTATHAAAAAQQCCRLDSHRRRGCFGDG